MVGSVASTATPRPARWALVACALDVGAVGSVACAPLVTEDDTVVAGWVFVILVLVVPPLAALAALAASLRSASEAKKSLAKLVAAALAVISGSLFLLWVVGLFLVSQGGGD